MEWQEYIKSKRVTLMGLGLLGRGIGDARFLAKSGADLLVTDLKSAEELSDSINSLKGLSITYHLGGHQLNDFRNRDLIVKAAGVRLDSPYIAEARSQGIPVRMSADLFAQFAHIPIVGVTGTRGKSTVSYLIAHLLTTAGKTVLLGGNIKGVSTLELLPQVTPDAIAVLELDSWQLQGFGGARISPDIAVFTTFMPDHMNYYHNDMSAYFADKANIFLHQSNAGTLLLGTQVRPYVGVYGYADKIKARTITAGTTDLPDVAFLLKGEHNRYNAGLAVAVARVLGLDETAIRAGLKTFKGVPGRLELLREIRGISIYNDTTATVPDATVAALKALDPLHTKNVLLIMGGTDKGLSMDELLREIPAYCKKTLLLPGSGTDRIKSGLSNTYIYQSLPEALHAAVADASRGDIVLFSPAFTSFGMFKNEYDRGEQFADAVASLS